jgi:3',5'-cyclic AMP phosphodiesterase CpdA
MTQRWNGQVAVLADPHLHDTNSGEAYGLPTANCFRSLAQSAASTRVFNEGGAALARALDILAERDVRLVMIAGDLTDDGQPPNWRASVDLLRHYSEYHNMRFFLTPGNHDQWCGEGKALEKEMVRRDGTRFVLSGSELNPTANLAPEMRQIGQAEVLAYASDFGFCRHPDDLHWESPFGASDTLSDRIGPISRPGVDPVGAPDLSYLVEPVSGLWILSIDANIYLPNATGWHDCGTEGWIAVLRHKAWLLDWMRDVARRAKASGKQLLTMSHFPAFDVLNEVPGGLSARVMPTKAVSDAVAATEIGLHFSGHWHINRTGGKSGADDWLINVAVPSTASFPAAFKLVDLSDSAAQIETVRLGQVLGFNAAFDRYLAEQPGSLLAQAENYHAFLTKHLRGLTGHRYLDSDWPMDFGPRLENASLADVLIWTDAKIADGAKMIPARLALDDYYFLERGGQLAGIPGQRLEVYKQFNKYGTKGDDEGAYRLVLGLARYSQALPDDAFIVDLKDGFVTSSKT